MYNYIPHPSNSRSSSGLVALRIDEGAAGYGIYWMVLELLRDAPAYRYSSSAKAIAFALNLPDVDQVQRVISSYGLFDVDDNGLLYCPWLEAQLSTYSDKKQALQEAGRRGAAKRWGKASTFDSHPIATLSQDDSHPMAYNITQPNITLHNPTPSGMDDGEAISLEFLESLQGQEHSGHNTRYIAQICYQYGMSAAAWQQLCEATDMALMESPRYQTLCAEVKRIQKEQFKPKHPLKFFLSKIQ